MRKIAAIRVLLVVALLCAGCEREMRTLHVPSAQAQAVRGPRAVVIHAGPGPESTQVASGVRPGRYRETAQAVQLGQQLFSSYNCSGCHSDGGGGMGPSLMDARWYYGHRPEQIFDTIVQGRPNGMPSFEGRIPAYQVWALVAYVRSLGGSVSRDAASGRWDHMEVRPWPNAMTPPPRQYEAPPASPDSAAQSETAP